MLQSVAGIKKGPQIIKHDPFASEEEVQSAEPQDRAIRRRPRRRRRSHDVIFKQGSEDARGATRLRLQSAAGQPVGPRGAAQLQYFRQHEERLAGCKYVQ